MLSQLDIGGISQPEEITKLMLDKYKGENLTSKDMEEIFEDIEELKENGTLFTDGY